MSTIVCDDKRFIFVHIPKCAGSIVSKELASLVVWDTWFVGRPLYDHPEAGRQMRAHLPLQVLRKYYPETFRKYANYETYAVLRDPESRFVSAGAEHVRAFRERDFFQISDAELKGTIDDVMRQMEQTPVFTPVDYGHFTRQIDYVDFEGRRMVRNLYRTETLDQLIDDLSTVHDLPLRKAQPRRNVRTGYKSRGAKVVMLVGGAISQAILPERAYQSLRGWARKKTTLTARSRLDVIFHSAAVRDFVRAFYADDHQLWESIQVTGTAA